jgi:hypothetical protein
LTGLKGLATDPVAASEFASVLATHYVELRGACVESRELLDAIGAKIPFASNVGMIDLARVAEASRSNTIHYVDTQQDFAHMSQLANAQGIVLLDASYVHDKPFLEAYAGLRGVSLVRMSSHADALVRPAPELAMRFAAVLSHARAALEPSAQFKARSGFTSSTSRATSPYSRLGASLHRVMCTRSAGPAIAERSVRIVRQSDQSATRKWPLPSRKVL